MSNEQLSEAFSRLSIVEVAARLGISLKEGAGQKSPFRPDKKAGSFSVQRNYFKDHACEEHCGGHIPFVMLARPDMTKGDVIKWLIEASGQEVKAYTRSQSKKVSTVKRKDEFRKRDAALKTLPKVDEPPEWAKFIRDRWETGRRELGHAPEKIAARRGWEPRCVSDLMMFNKMAFPSLPWSYGDGHTQKRGYAFIVEKPAPVMGSSGRCLDLVPVGYHQRFIAINRVTGDKKKQWVFVPYVPSKKQGEDARAFKKRLTHFQQLMVTDAVKLPTYPFVMGDLHNTKLVVILEGQWDAITFAEAFGWIDSEYDIWPEGVAVFGLRGNQSIDVFLAAYGRWLAANQPFVWIIGDNDEAGRSLIKRKDPEKINAAPSFVDRIRAQGCRCKVQYLTGFADCKDFNDVYKARRPSLDDMRKWAHQVGVLELIGGEV